MTIYCAAVVKGAVPGRIAQPPSLFYTFKKRKHTACLKQLAPRFNLSLTKPVLKALGEIGYEIPTPIQAETIPLMLAQRDVLGQAQTGTGKTAAFALPLLAHIEIKNRSVQVLVLTPTRELAIQVAEAFQRYAAHIKDFHVLPIYGGQSCDGQLRALKRGVHVVVGTRPRHGSHETQNASAGRTALPRPRRGR